MSKNGVCAIVVFYKANEKEFLNLTQTSKQFEKTLVIFNGITPTDKVLINEYFQNNNIQTIINTDNEGMSVALNQGVKMAIKLGFKFVLTLDQDSTLTENMVVKMLDTYKQMIADGVPQDSIGIIEPVLVDKNTGFKKIRSQKSDKNYGEIDDCYTSGNLISTKIFEQIGFYYEPFFVYGTDTDFNIRLQNQGKKIYEVKNAELMHQEGSLKFYKLFGLEFSSTNHSPFARYFIARNTLLLWKKYWLTNPKWFLNSVNWYIRTVLKVFLFEDKKWTKLKMALKGTWHGLINKTGKL